MSPPTILVEAWNMNVPRHNASSRWQLLLALGVILLSGSDLGRAQAFVPTGVDDGLVGTWQVVTPTPAGTARWVWEIFRNGTYSFHAEGPGAAPAHSGTFAASKGHYILNSTTMAWQDSGTYQLTGGATLVTTGKLGTGTWHRVPPLVTGRPRLQSQPITIRK
jgi:hypothetical protein